MLDINQDGFVGEKDFELISQNFSQLYKWSLDSPEFDDIQDQFTSQWHGYLHLADRNGDDLLSEEEFIENFDRQFAAKQGYDAPLFKQFIRTMCDILNVSGTGEISQEEYFYFCKAHGLQDDEIEVGFQKIDPIGLGSISRTEFLRAIREFFCSNDPNSSGNWIFGDFDYKSIHPVDTFNEAETEVEAAAKVTSAEIVDNIPVEMVDDIPANLDDYPLPSLELDRTDDSPQERSPKFTSYFSYVQARLEPILLEYIGPVASIYLNQATLQVFSIPDLIERLSQYVPATRQAEFQAAVNTEIETIDAELKQGISTKPISLSPLTNVTNDQIGQDFIDRCEQELIDIIGPMARLILQRTLALEPSSQTQLVELLAQQLPSPAYATKFRDRFS
ncbi:EF-hand domain-containing protein [Tumidithrix elongata RA019]|uniref:EF-hand domain-containing protein n=2 Tax=Tumidithrix TaxID=3088355 RepID=A0AAW9PZ70_9CYAN|nr:EF-hand domain-containing protein [Tumidithrix elongata RA019]